MARVKKVLLRPAVFATPQGPLTADHQRIAHWARQFHAMRSEGLNIPVSWGHQKDAVPCYGDELSQRAYWLSRYNAGYVGDMKDDPRSGTLSSILDVPGCELDGDSLVTWVELADGRRVKTAIKEVSAAIKDWTDGRGKVWKDAIVHVALTPHPVAHGTGGFSPESLLNTLDANNEAVTLSLASVLYTLGSSPMADDNDNDDRPKKDSDKPTKEGSLSKALGVLANLGLTLPDDTNDGNFIERIIVAGTALDGKGGGLDDDLDDLGEPAEGAPPAPVQEERPVMLSLATAKTERERKAVEVTTQKHKQRQLKRIDRLVTRFGLNPRHAAELRDSYNDGYQLSLDDDMQPVPQQTDVVLSIVENIVAQYPRIDQRTGALKHDNIPARPDQQGTQSAEESRREIEERAKRVSRVI
jgi:hypothetical protein